MDLESLHFDSLGLHAWLGRLTRASRYFGCLSLGSARIVIDDTEVGIACITSSRVFISQEAWSRPYDGRSKVERAEVGIAVGTPEGPVVVEATWAGQKLAVEEP